MISLTGEVNEGWVTHLFLADPEDTEICIDSPGGDAHVALVVCEVLQRRKVTKIVALGDCSSSATYIFFSTPQRARYCLPSTRFLFHCGTVSMNELSQQDLAAHNAFETEMGERLSAFLPDELQGLDSGNDVILSGTEIIGRKLAKLLPAKK